MKNIKKKNDYNKRDLPGKNKKRSHKKYKSSTEAYLLNVNEEYFVN